MFCFDLSCGSSWEPVSPTEITSCKTRLAKFCVERNEEQVEAKEASQCRSRRSRSRDQNAARQASLEVEQREQLRLFKQAVAAAEMHEERALDARRRRAVWGKDEAAVERERIWQAQERHRLQQEQEERKKLVNDFLKRHGFVSVNSLKLSLISSTYPLHKAAELGDATMVSLLLQEGADCMQKNSSGKTAVQVAQRKDKAGSHRSVLAVFLHSYPTESAPRHGGA